MRRCALARFNTNIGVVDKRYFPGLAVSPAAAALVDGFHPGHDEATRAFKHAHHGLADALGGGSAVRRLDHGHQCAVLQLQGRQLQTFSVPVIVIVAIVLGIAVINIDPPRMLFRLFCAYDLSGYVVYGWQVYRKASRSVCIATSTDEPMKRACTI